MNKNKKNRKGFTIVELVIVIAVIGILATVLVPTFGDVIGKANASKDLQAAKNAYTLYVGKVNYAGGDTAEEVVYYDGAKVDIVIENGKATEGTLPTNECYARITADGEVTHVHANDATDATKYQCGVAK